MQSFKRKKTGKTGRSESLVRQIKDNDISSLYAAAVDRYFKSVPDKDVRFRAYSKEEERAMIEKYKNDRQSMENELTEHNIFFAINYASSQSYRFQDYDELISLAMNGLRAAATTFDETKGYRFNTWVAFYLKKFILRKFYVKKESEIDNNVGVYLDANIPTVSDDSSSEYVYATMKNSVEPGLEEKFNRTFVDDIEHEEKENKLKDYAHRIIQSVATSSLSTIDKSVFNLSFIGGKSVSSISKELKISRNLVTESKTRVLTYINSNFSKDKIFS